MIKNKTAILIDSGTDVAPELITKYNMYVLPLRIIFSDGEYIDKVNINTNQLFDRLSTEIPSTSLPSGEDIVTCLEQIKADGYDSVIAITISAALSGTHNFIDNLKTEVEGLTVSVIDTKNIGVGAGMSAVQVAELLAEGTSYEQTLATVEKTIENNDIKIFFTTATLEYLKKGGRIGLVAATIGEVLNIKPIISCNEAGVYHTVGKSRGARKSLDKIIDLAREVIASSNKKFKLAFTYGNNVTEFERFKQKALDILGNPESYFEAQVSPALGVHTGPEAYGLAIQIIE